MKTIFVGGLLRSGTTYLSITLAKHPDLVAVGEVWDIITLRHNSETLATKVNNCTCGNRPCGFWHEVIEEVKKYELNERYGVFLNIFQKHFPGKVPVDSSKELDAYYALSESSTCIPIHLIRDARGYTYSITRRNFGRGKIKLRTMLSWYRNNKKIEAKMEGSIKLGYEYFIFNQKGALKEVYKALKLKNNLEENDEPASNVHILSGNRMRKSQNKGIKYDTEWMKDSNLYSHLVNFLVTVPVLSYNKERSYSINYK